MNWKNHISNDDVRRALTYYYLDRWKRTKHYFCQKLSEQKILTMYKNRVHTSMQSGRVPFRVFISIVTRNPSVYEKPL
jgi:hypothetical protein